MNSNESKRPILKLKFPSPSIKSKAIHSTKQVVIPSSISKPSKQKEKTKITPHKVAISKMEKTTSSSPEPKKLGITKEEYNSILSTLKKKYPQAFPRTEVRLLKVGIHAEIAKALNIKTNKAYFFCKLYCRKKLYKEAVAKNKERYGLINN